MRVTVRGRRLTYTVLASGMRFSDRRLGVAYNMLAVMGKLERCVVHEIGFHCVLSNFCGPFRRFF